MNKPTKEQIYASTYGAYFALLMDRCYTDTFAWPLPGYKLEAFEEQAAMVADEAMSLYQKRICKKKEGG